MERNNVINICYVIRLALSWTTPKCLVEDIRQVGFYMMSFFWRNSGKFWTVTGYGNYTKGSVVRRECSVGERKFLTSLLPFLSLLIEKEMSAQALAPPTMLQLD